MKTLEEIENLMSDKKYTEEEMLFIFMQGAAKFEENKDVENLSKNFKQLIKILDLARLKMLVIAENEYTETDIINAIHNVELKDNKTSFEIYKGMKEYLHSLKKDEKN